MWHSDLWVTSTTYRRQCVPAWTIRTSPVWVRTKLNSSTIRSKDEMRTFHRGLVVLRLEHRGSPGNGETLSNSSFLNLSLRKGALNMMYKVRQLGSSRQQHYLQGVETETHLKRKTVVTATFIIKDKSSISRSLSLASLKSFFGFSSK